MILYRKYKKKWVIFGGVLLAMAVILGYVFYSYHSWQSYGRFSADQQHLSQVDLNKVLVMPVVTPKDRQQVRSKLEEVTNTLKTRADKQCHSAFLTDWQTRFIKNPEDTRKECEKSVIRTKELIAKLSTASLYLKAEQSTTSFFGTVSALPDQLDEKQWEGAAQAWKLLEKKVATGVYDASFAATHGVVLGAVKQISLCWQELVVSNEAKDKSRFTKARSNLVASYEQLGGINDENEKQLSKFITDVETSYTQAF